VTANVRSPLWRWTDIASWFENFDGSQTIDRRDADLVSAVNDVLAARRALRPVDRATRQALLRQLVP